MARHAAMAATRKKCLLHEIRPHLLELKTIIKFIITTTANTTKSLNGDNTQYILDKLIK